MYPVPTLVIHLTFLRRLKVLFTGKVVIPLHVHPVYADEFNMDVPHSIDGTDKTKLN